MTLKPLLTIGFPGYFAREDGKIISYKYKKPRVLKGEVNNSGYLRLYLCKDGKPFRVFVHIIIGILLHGFPRKGEQFHHEDRNPLNNSFDNIKKIHYTENLKARKWKAREKETECPF